MSQGRLITLEGIEGVGKSTHAEAVAQAYRDAGRAVVCTREPGGTEIGDRIRGLLLDPGGAGPLAETELLLMFAARSEHLARVIRPALAAGSDVVCDRFTDATYAYQGGGRGIDSAWIATLEQRIQIELRPDYTLLFDCPVATALARARGGGDGDRFERETTAFFERAREVYLQRAGAEPERFRVIDAARPIAEVRAAVLAALPEAG